MEDVQLLVLVHVEVVNLLVIVDAKLLVLIHVILHVKLDVKVVHLLVILDVKVVLDLKVTIHVVVVLVVQGIVMANYLKNIVNYKFDNQCIYNNHYNLGDLQCKEQSSSKNQSNHGKVHIPCKD